MEDEFYMRRLDAGLFSLQLIDCIIMEVCSSGVSSVNNSTFHQRSISYWLLYLYVTFWHPRRLRSSDIPPPPEKKKHFSQALSSISLETTVIPGKN